MDLNHRCLRQSVLHGMCSKCAQRVWAFSFHVCCSSRCLLATPAPGPGRPHLLKVVDDVCGVAAPKLGNGYIDALVVLLEVDLHVLLQLHASVDLGGQGVLIEDAAVEEVVSGQLSKAGSRARERETTWSHSALSEAPAACPTTPGSEGLGKRGGWGWDAQFTDAETEKHGSQGE